MWINVNDRLPDDNKHYLTYSSDFDGNKYRIITMNNGKFYSAVTHWMPLVPPPEKDDNDETM